MTPDFEKIADHAVAHAAETLGISEAAVLGSLAASSWGSADQVIAREFRKPYRGYFPRSRMHIQHEAVIAEVFDAIAIALGDTRRVQRIGEWTRPTGPEDGAQTIHFNTGRLYAADGQRITATRHADGVITFFDHSRMIDGEISDLITRSRIYADDAAIRARVMACYDGGNWTSTKRSADDAMRIGGINSVYVDPSARKDAVDG